MTTIFLNGTIIAQTIITCNLQSKNVLLLYIHNHILNLTNGNNMFYKQIILNRGLPFKVKMPTVE